MEYGNSGLEDLIKGSSNSVNELTKFPIYLATVATSLSAKDDLTELDKLQEHLSKYLKVSIYIFLLVANC